MQYLVFTNDAAQGNQNEDQHFYGHTNPKLFYAGSSFEALSLEMWVLQSECEMKGTAWFCTVCSTMSAWLYSVLLYEKLCSKKIPLLKFGKNEYYVVLNKTWN